MTLYTQIAPTTVLWPEPIESTWQCLPSGRPTSLAPKLPHLSLADVFFIGAVMAIPSHRRPWGAATWLADVFSLSRVSVYALRDRLQEKLLATTQPAALLTAPRESASGHTVSVTSNRLARTVLAATFPGNVSIRPLQGIMHEAFDQQRSVGWISQLGMVLRLLSTSRWLEEDTMPFCFRLPERSSFNLAL